MNVSFLGDQFLKDIFLQVKVSTLDSLIPILKQERKHQAILKVDAEGSEARILLGGLQFLQQIDVPVIFLDFEWIRETLDGSKTPTSDRKMCEKFLEAVERLGYVATVEARLPSDPEALLHFSQVEKWPNDVILHKNITQFFKF